ncbi:MAG: hypothetical protein GY715_03410 [Planctomycetes bacterium]|nr:hypothetical protein [Planctomycetota bacterium]
MLFLISAYLLAIAVWLIYVMIRDHVRGTCEFLSIRNIVVGGFILFQLTSPAIALTTGDYGRRPVEDPIAAGLEFAVMVTIFLPLFFWAYRKGWIVDWLASKMPEQRGTPGVAGMLALSVIATIVAVPLRLNVPIPLVSVVAGHVSVGMASLACGIVGWVWGRRLLNPGFLFFSVVIVCANALTVMTGAFGRRGLVAIACALLWGMYYSSWRHLALSALMHRLALLSIVPILFIAMFSSVRESGKTRSALGHLREIASGARLADGLSRLAHGQDCGAISMWLIETHPEDFEYRHLMTIKWFFIYAVPRSMWESKPVPISVDWKKMANVTTVGKDHNVGPGIIGSAAAEGGLYALLIYGIVGGLFIRFFDATVAHRWSSPLIILTMGCALGQMLAMPRGETASFAAVAVITITGVLLLVFLTTRFLEATGLVQMMVEEEYEDEPFELEHAETASW